MSNKIKTGIRAMFWPTLLVLLVMGTTVLIGVYFGMAAFTLAVALVVLLGIAYPVGDYKSTDDKIHQYLSDVDDEINGLLVRIPRYEWDMTKKELREVKDRIIVATVELENAILWADRETVADLKGRMYNIMRGLERLLFSL